jgi:single-stranded-DNA-specific exonuclease
VVDRTGRPALVITHADGDAHGSGRSIPGFHLLDAITAAATTDPGTPLFHRFGGHAHAVGFSLPSSRLADLRARMSAYTAARLDSTLLLPQLDYDAELGLEDINAELAAWLGRCAPFGIGNPEPIFRTRGAILAAPIRLIQDKHVCLQLCASRQPQPGQPTLSSLGWSRGPSDWPQRCSGLSQGSVIDIVYRLRQRTGNFANPHFGGLELELCDLRPATQSV